MPTRTDVCLALLAVLAIVAALLMPWGDAAAQEPAQPVTTEDLAAEWQEGAAGPVPMEERGAMASIRARLESIGANPGTGFRLADGAQACWEGGSLPGRQRHYPIDLSVRPWGPTGDGGRNDALFAEKYKAGRLDETGWPCGPAAELADSWSDRALRAAYTRQCSLPLSPTCGTDPCDGNPTAEERWDFVTTTPRCSSVIRACVWATAPGGTPDNPIIVDASTGTRARQAEANGWCTVGAVEAEKSTVCGGWPSYYRVTALPAMRPWCDAVTPPPAPAPAPVPPPPPPECEPLEMSAFAKRCREAPGLPDDLTECRKRAEANPGSLLAGLVSRVCVEEPGPDPPPVRDARLEVSEVRFVPGIPSTGRLEIELTFPPVRYEVQVCRDGTWSPSHDVAALPGEWAEVDAGECGVRWREVTP